MFSFFWAAFDGGSINTNPMPLLNKAFMAKLCVSPQECLDAIGVTAIFFTMSGFFAGMSYLLYTVLD